MKYTFLLIIIVTLSGCVVYPARHVSEPQYEISISGDNISSVTISSSLNAESGTCTGGKILKHSGSNKFVSNPEHSWFKLVFMVPINSIKPIKICAKGMNNQIYYWDQDIGILPNHYPKVWKFNCDASEGSLDCAKIT